MKEMPIPEFDMMTLPEYIHLVKAIIPFMEFGTQQTLSAMLRAYEFSCTINYYNRPESLRLAACSSKPHLSLNSSIQDIIGDDSIMEVILMYCPDNIKSIINNLKSYNKMSDLFNFINHESGNILNPAQQKMYETYSEQLNNLNI